MQVRKKMWSLTRILIQLRRDTERSRFEAMVEHRCSVGYVARIIERGIFHSTRVVDTKSIVLKRRIQLGMLFIIFLRFMQLWKAGR